MLGRGLHRKADTEVRALSSGTRPAWQGLPQQTRGGQEGGAGGGPTDGTPSPLQTWGSASPGPEGRRQASCGGGQTTSLGAAPGE